jgi:type VI secretion system Hcp family effector
MASQHNPKGFMKLEGAKIQGDSNAKGFEGQVIVLNLAFSVTQSGSHETERKSVQTNLSEVTVTKFMGSSSSELLQACAKKVPFTKVEIVIVGKLQITLEHVIITSVHVSVNTEDEHPTESVSLSCQKVTWLSWTDKVKGTGSFDLILNDLE